MKENLFPNLKNSAVETNEITHYLSEVLSSSLPSTTLSSTSMTSTNRINSEIDAHKDDIKDHGHELQKLLFSDKTFPVNLNREDNEDQDGMLKQSYSNTPSTSNANLNHGCSVPYNPECPEDNNNYGNDCVDEVSLCLLIKG